MGEESGDISETEKDVPEVENIWGCHCMEPTYEEIDQITEETEVKNGKHGRFLIISKDVSKRRAGRRHSDKKTSFLLPAEKISIPAKRKRRKKKSKKWKPKIKRTEEKKPCWIALLELQIWEYLRVSGVLRKIAEILSNVYEEKNWPKKPLKYISSRLDAKKPLDFKKAESLVKELQKYMILEGHILAEIRRLKVLYAVLLPNQYYPNGRPRTPPSIQEEEIVNEEAKEIQSKKMKDQLSKPSVISKKGKGKKDLQGGKGGEKKVKNPPTKKQGKK